MRAKERERSELERPCFPSFQNSVMLHYVKLSLSLYKHTRTRTNREREREREIDRERKTLFPLIPASSCVCARPSWWEREKEREGNERGRGTREGRAREGERERPGGSRRLGASNSRELRLRSRLFLFSNNNIKLLYYS